jgi:arginase family enzyme
LFMNLEEEADALIERLRHFNSVYLSLNLSILDPACASLINNMQPAGISPREIVYLIQRLRILDVSHLEICGIAKRSDSFGITYNLISKLISEME